MGFIFSKNISFCKESKINNITYPKHYPKLGSHTDKNMSHSSSSIESHDLHTYRTNLFSILNQENPPKGLLFQPNSSPWIFDCGAINTMTYNSSDLINTTPTTHTQIQTANRDCVSVTKTGTVEISPSINLRNCLLIPSLTHKLLSVSQFTKELNCINIMSSTNCVVQDA